MEPNKSEIPNDVPKLPRKTIKDKRDIKKAFKNKKSLSGLAKEKDIHFAYPKIMAYKNPLVQMVEDNKKIISVVKNGEKISSVKGIKFVSPL